MSEQFGKMVRQARLKKDLSLRDVADMGVGISFSYISKLEKGFYDPSKQVVCNLAMALDIPEDAALIAAGYAPTQIIHQDDKTTKYVDPSVQKLMEKLTVQLRADVSLTEKEKELILEDTMDFLQFKLQERKRKKE